MLKNLKNIVKHAFSSKQSRAQDQELLEALNIGDSVDEPTSYAVLLMDLALADGTASKEEISVIRHTLLQIFPDRKLDADILIEAARNILSSFRTQKMFVAKIKEEYSQQEREKLYEVIESVIQADGFEDDMEKYLRTKFRDLLS
jgi:uncharacterized tellurite resistance protein B-like protein